MRTHRNKAGRAALVVAAAIAATLTSVSTAAAHAEVEADTTQALAENVTLTFTSEAESDSAGFKELRIVLPKGIAPDDVRLDEAPKGWELKTTDDGYSVAGPALKTGIDAVHKITVRQLPDAKEIAFKTVETYSDGEVSRWIELPDGGAELEQPAPLLKLSAAAPGATPVAESPTPRASPTPSATASTTPTPTSTPQAADTASDEDDDSSAGLVVGGVVVVVLVLGAGAWWLIRRRTTRD
ncbi:DUF1775 domain-containing protein [Streptomyces cinnabarinus]|uniref:DUF1775 domain-containing protein n=1 Tax=Streptomyces cinnabarinus TaxID=67287 RepID=A0ABY7KR31_9ACTN|nr:DUF1775 domain-containing protein [Streptomyces cinnabarinus]WAZ26045.1 DUF1775 domain-containing protein [Streptomyces cinnabarinus]